MLYQLRNDEKQEALLQYFSEESAAEISGVKNWEVREIEKNQWLFSPLFQDEKSAKDCSEKITEKLGVDLFPVKYKRTQGVTYSRSASNQYRVILDLALFDAAYEIYAKREKEAGFKLSL